MRTLEAFHQQHKHRYTPRQAELITRWPEVMGIHEPSACKAVLLSDSVPACYRDPVLVVLEAIVHFKEYHYRHGFEDGEMRLLVGEKAQALIPRSRWSRRQKVPRT
ncbi:hypothetical protein AK812_SmicGene15264 [Symbiodinium microadriaticum]|uniref:Uncharacterized protein n=1 Tax=Symbiodinium microadriaticum TaxID=2951 RepID=A0A1Q9E3E5_SYMMI|nr:hypothetical protein AK812_SmicGene15264 [Symbiodinium microadriaticum]